MSVLADLAPSVSDEGKTLADTDPRPENESDEIEDGELPEEGEISDDEPEPQKIETPQQSAGALHEKTQSRKSCDLEDFLREKSEQLRQKVQKQLELAGNSNVVVDAKRENEPNVVLPDSLEKPSHKGPKYRDLDPRPGHTDPTDIIIDSWLKGKKKAKHESSFDPNEEYYGYGSGAAAEVLEQGEVTVEKETDKDYRRRADTDYRWPRFGSDDERQSGGSPDGTQSNEFGDRDYRDRKSRHERRRRRDSDDDSMDGIRRRTSPRRKRRRSGSPFRRRPSRWGDRPSICKFYREGFCRDGDSCTYSHNAGDSMRRGELCKYYQQGYCKKSQQCQLLHGEYPCKAYHKGECSKDPCPYSHQTLNDFTKPIFEQMLRDEELAAKITIPVGPTKRKVLLAAPPPPMQLPNQPSVMHPPAATSMPPPHLSPPTMPFPMPHDLQQDHQPNQSPFHAPYVPPFVPMDTMPPPVAMATPERIPEQPPPDSGSGNASFDINEMLRKIKAQVHGDDEAEESPASPPMAPVVDAVQEVQKIPSIGVPVYRLILVDVPSAPNSNIDPEVLQKSLTEPKLRNDPRIKKLLDSQFNAVSNMISAKTDPKEETRPVPSDPRTARDPRLKKAGQTAASSSPSSTGTGNATDATMQQMIDLQLQMTAAMQAQMGMPPVMPQLSLPPAPSGMAAPMAGPMMPVMAPSAPPSSVVAAPPNPSGAWMPNLPPFEQANGPNNGRRNGSSRWREDSLSPPDDSMSQDTDDRPVSLREKRKDLQYESPLNRGASGSDASRYNQMPNVRVRKKNSPLLD